MMAQWTLIIVRDTSDGVCQAFEALHHLQNQFDFPFVETHLVKEVKLCLQDHWSLWIMDHTKHNREASTGLSEERSPWILMGI
ncbi:unnamed protein product [Ranitomeya imitator]|uniref:Ceramide kinase C-terminal domain-containing protein n=1 Tax=Ranitomeya imitator TaxID=111125 RepID=A0ABN9L6P7_9NEOB|nr:unnamed protein product [Ranitomeya imitator]